jgi:hypothetical protein
MFGKYNGFVRRRGFLHACTYFLVCDVTCTRSKLMSITCGSFKIFIFRDRFSIGKQTFKKIFCVLWRDFRWYAKEKNNDVWSSVSFGYIAVNIWRHLFKASSIIVFYYLFLIFISQGYIQKVNLFNLQRFGHFKCPSSGDNCC